jgi:GAF domain-containing protein
MTSWDSDHVARLVVELAGEDDVEPTLDGVLRQVLEAAPDVDGVSLTLRGARGRWVVLGATSDLAERVVEEQHSRREGPCLAAALGAAWVRSGDVGADDRWPSWGPVAARAGVASVFSVGLTASGEGIGALGLLAGARRAFDDQEVVDLVVLAATHAARSLDAARLAPGLSTALSPVHRIGLAQGIAMARYSLGADEAAALLDSLAARCEVDVRDLAAELVETGRLAVLDDGRLGPWPGDAR